MTFKRSSLAFGVMLTVLMAGQASADEATPSYKKIVTKLTGATVGAASGYGIMYRALPWLFNNADFSKSDRFGKIFAETLRVLAVAGMTYAGAEYAWWLMPEGKIENSKKVIAKYEYLLNCCMHAGDKLFDVLDAYYVGNDMALLAAYKDINCARSQLNRAEAGLTKLVYSTSFNQEAAHLLSTVTTLRKAAEQALIMIARHPLYAQFKQIEEIRLARQAPTIQYTYQLN